MFKELFKDYCKCNRYLLGRNSDDIINRFTNYLDDIDSIEDLIDTFDYKTIRSFNNKIKEFILGFYAKLKMEGYQIESLLYGNSFPTDVNSRRLALAKFLHNNPTLQQIQEEFNMSERTAEYDIDALRNGININGVEIKLDIVNRNKKYYCSSTIHPIFLPLNLTEVYALSKYLPTVLKNNNINNEVLNDLFKKINCQLSDYALDRLELEKKEFKVSFKEEAELYKKDRQYRILYACKSGCECVLLLEDKSFTGKFKDENTFETSDSTIDLKDKSFDFYINN